jgi:hypothetical protein
MTLKLPLMNIFVQEMVRWSSLLFAMSFTLSGFLQTTMQFPYARKHIPAVFCHLLPYFVLWVFLSDMTAFGFLYVALVALDLGPEFYGGRAPVIVPLPYTSGKGNFTPGYIIIVGVAAIGYPWYMAVWRSIYKTLFHHE